MPKHPTHDMLGRELTGDPGAQRTMTPGTAKDVDMQGRKIGTTLDVLTNALRRKRTPEPTAPIDPSTVRTPDVEVPSFDEGGPVPDPLQYSEYASDVGPKEAAWKAFTAFTPPGWAYSLGNEIGLGHKAAERGDVLGLLGHAGGATLNSLPFLGGVGGVKAAASDVTTPLGGTMLKSDLGDLAARASRASRPDPVSEQGFAEMLKNIPVLERRTIPMSEEEKAFFRGLQERTAQDAQGPYRAANEQPYLPSDWHNEDVPLRPAGDPLPHWSDRPPANFEPANQEFAPPPRDYDTAVAEQIARRRASGSGPSSADIGGKTRQEVLHSAQEHLGDARDWGFTVMRAGLPEDPGELAAAFRLLNDALDPIRRRGAGMPGPRDYPSYGIYFSGRPGALLRNVPHLTTFEDGYGSGPRGRQGVGSGINVPLNTNPRDLALFLGKLRFGPNFTLPPPRPTVVRADGGGIDNPDIAVFYPQGSILATEPNSGLQSRDPLQRLTPAQITQQDVDATSGSGNSLSQRIKQIVHAEERGKAHGGALGLMHDFYRD